MHSAKIQKVNNPKWIKDIDDSYIRDSLWSNNIIIKKQTQEIADIISKIYGIQTANKDILNEIYDFIFNIYSQNQVEISMTDFYVDNKILNIYDNKGDKLQSGGIDFNLFEKAIKNSISQHYNKQDNTKRETIKLNQIIYSQRNNHVWIIYNYWGKASAPQIFYTYLTVDQHKLGDITLNQPLIKLSADCMKEMSVWMDPYCASNGDLYLLSGLNIWYISLNAIKYELNNNQDMIIESDTFQWAMYKITNINTTNFLLYSGKEIDAFFGGKYTDELNGNRDYLCCFDQSPFLRINVFDLIESKLCVEYVDKSIIVSDIINDNTEDENNKKQIKLYKFDLNHSKIICCCSNLVDPERMYSSYNLYAFYINLFEKDNDKKINDLKLLKNDIYGEGGFVVDYILDSINNDKYYIWFRINGRGIGYNVTEYLELNKIDLNLINSKRGYYENPVDKTVVIQI